MTDFMQPHFTLQQILNGGHQQLDELFNSINAAPLALRTSTADKFFARVFARNPLDAACAPLLQQLKTVFVTQACQSDLFYCDQNHPLRELFHCIITRASTWYPREAKLNQQFFDKLSHLIQLATDLPDKAAKLTSSLQEFYHWDDAEEKRAAMLEVRLCESELNYLKMLTAECHVLDLINEALTGSMLPSLFIEHIPHTLKTELQHCAVTTGESAPLWKIWQRLLPLIVDVFNSDTLDSGEQQLYRHIPLMLHELERSLDMDIANPGSYRQLVDDLSQLLLKTIRRQPPELARQDMLPYPAGHSDTRTRATDAVLQQSAALAQGDWILFNSEDGPTIRCKLALKNPTTDQLLFVDRTGRKVMIKSSKDFSLCLSTGIAKHLEQTPLTDMIAELVQALITLHSNNLQKQQHNLQASSAAESVQAPSVAEQLQQLKQQQRHSEQQQIEQKIRDEQQRHALDFAEKRRAAAEKALAEAKALADEKTARAVAAALAEKNQQEQQQASREAEQLHQQLLAQQQINALNVGAWIERLDENMQMQRCKLAVFIAAVGKYIFVDNLGRKVAEYQREALLEAFLFKQVSIINNGDKFEDQLAKVIRSLRKDTSQ